MKIPIQSSISRLCQLAANATLVLGVLCPSLIAGQAAAQTYSYSVVYSFGTATTDGSDPIAGLVLDAQGNLYGTTNEGGALGYGTVFKVDATGKETVLHNFAGVGGGDGAHPHAGLALDAQGNLYGTTWMGGAYGQTGRGTVFKVDATGNETVLFKFNGPNGDGTKPSGLVLDAQGNLYGTTAVGGASGANKDGTAFKLDTAGNETTLHTFRMGPEDGANPYGGVVLDAEGNLYGTTARGGFYTIFPGSVFKLDTTGIETVLHRFAGSPDGANPYAGVVLDAQGNMYGTTDNGGTAGYGTVFKVDSSGNETVLYSFTGLADDSNPVAGLVLDGQGNLYGTTEGGGAYRYGTVFELSASGTETVLHSFGSAKDGRSPFAGLVLDTQGNLYGTTAHGGVHGKGTVFKLTLQ